MENKQEEQVLLKVENLSQYFPLGNQTLKAVDHVSFDIKKGEVFGLVGESGCGKTTTGRTIIRIYNPSTGNVYFNGKRIGAGIQDYKEEIKNTKSEEKKTIKEINDAVLNGAKSKEDADLEIQKLKESNALKIKDLKKEISSAKYDQKHTKKDVVTKIQMIFQDPIASLDPRMTVKEIISEGLVIQGVKDKKYIEEKVYEMLELVGLVREHADRYPHEFSGGQRQRIGIARAIIMNPELIIADEPVSALDVSIQAQVINLLNELREKMGLTILFIAHDLSVVKYFSNRIGVMYFGKMVELTTSDELFAHPLHPYTRSLLSAIPLPDPEYEKKRKRFTYNPLAEHDYSKQEPTLREIVPGHFVLCNDEEEKQYLEILNGDSKATEPVEEAVAEETTPVEETVAEEATPVEEAVAEEAAPAEETVAEEAAPVEETVAEETAPVEETVAEEAAPVEETVAEETTPVEETVAEEATPVEETVAEEAAPAEETVAEEATPVEETVAEEVAPVVEAKPAKKTTKSTTTKAKSTTTKSKTTSTKAKSTTTKTKSTTTKSKTTTKKAVNKEEE